MKNKIEMQKFLESKGIKVTQTEGDDFSAVFHISNEDRTKIKENQKSYEDETGLYLALSDMGGMSVVIMENDED